MQAVAGAGLPPRLRMVHTTMRPATDLAGDNQEFLFKIVPAMFNEAALDLLGRLAQKEITSIYFFQQLKLALAGQEEHDPEDWNKLVYIVVTEGLVGFRKITETLQQHNPNASTRSPSESAPTLPKETTPVPDESPVPQGSSSSSVHPRPFTQKSRRATKRRKTASIFVDISAVEDDDDEEEDPEDLEDWNQESRSRDALKVLPAGQASYAQQLERLFERYQGHQPHHAEGQPLASPPLSPHQLQLDENREGQIYIVEFATKGMVKFCRTILESRGLHCWEVTRMPNKIYVEATGSHHIRSACPPSHTSAIRGINLISEEDRPFLHASQLSIRPHSWVRVLRGLYKDDIGYVLSSDSKSCDLLIVPRRRPYDKMDTDTRDGTDHKFHERKLFDEAEARSAGCTVLPFNRNAGIWRCEEEFYHRGLLRRSFTTSSVETVEAPHPDRIALHVQAQVDPDLIERTHLLFSARFWREGDLVRPQNGPLVDQSAIISSVNLDQGVVTVHPRDPDFPACTLPILDVRRIFSPGDAVKVLAGVHRGSTGHVLTSSESEVTIMREANDVIGVPPTFLETYLTPHVWSLTSSQDGRRIFQHGDIVKVLTGSHRGSLSTVIKPNGNSATVQLESKDVITIPSKFLEPYTSSHASRPGLVIDSLRPEHNLDEIMQGDFVEINAGQYCGSKGVLDGFDTERRIWVSIPRGDNGTVVLVDLDDVKIRKPQSTLTLSKEKGYNVTIGDVLQIVRGVHCGVIGVVKKIDFPNGEVELISEVDGCHITIPIPLCTAVAQYSQPDIHPVGRTIWVIGGEKRGLRGTLYTQNRTSSVVSIPGYPTFEVSNKHLATEKGELLNGTRLQGAQLDQFKALVARSWVSEPLPVRPATPIHSPEQSSASAANDRGDDSEAGPSNVTVNDPVQSPPEAIDKGTVEWLFDHHFCDFSQHQLCFDVSVRYQGGRYANRILRTTCPDRFTNNQGRAPPGCVAMVVTGNHAGSVIEHHHVPARFLSARPPLAKNQWVLVLRGDLRGRFCQVVRWGKKEQKVVISPPVSGASEPSSQTEPVVLTAEDVCLAIPSC